MTGETSEKLEPARINFRKATEKNITNKDILTAKKRFEKKTNYYSFCFLTLFTFVKSIDPKCCTLILLGTYGINTFIFSNVCQDQQQQQFHKCQSQPTMFFLPFCEEKKLVINIHLRRLSPLMLLWWIVAAEKRKVVNFFFSFF